MKKLEGIRDVLKHSKRRRPTQIFCPRCASPKIELAKSVGSLEIWLTPKEYYCPECGYHGIIVMELEPIDEENQTETEPHIEKNEAENKEEKEKAP
jgi:Zn finger protein HypA/HybF involved in hydrogenase expression